MVWFMMMICMLYLSAKGDMDKDMICVIRVRSLMFRKLMTRQVARF